MEKRQRVLLYGDTLVLAGLRASLEAAAAFDIIHLDAMHATEQDLVALHPTIIIFDTSSIQPQLRRELVQELPGLLLIGVDPGSNEIVVWSGKYYCAMSSQDFFNVILKEHANSRIPRGGIHEKQIQSF